MLRTILGISVCGVCLAAAPARAFFSTGAGANIDGFLGPSSGSFVTQRAVPGEENYYLVSNLTITRAAADWRLNLDEVMASTWFALDRYGPFGADGTATYGTGWYDTTTGPAGVTHIPEWNGALVTPDGGLVANGHYADPVNGDGLSPGFYGAHAGFVATANGTSTRSAPTLINEQVLDSLFIAHVVLSDPDATLVGDDLLFFETNVGTAFLPLDGSPGTYLDGDPSPYRLETQRTTFTNSLGTFTAIDLYVVPTPAGAAPLLGAALLVRRRRRY